MASTTTLKLPPDLRERVARLAKQTGRTPHSLMVEAIEKEVRREVRMRAFILEAQRADRAIDRTGEAYAAEDVHRWLRGLARGRKVPRPKPWRR
jgi:predicted transcriptional regulator